MLRKYGRYFHCKGASVFIGLKYDKLNTPELFFSEVRKFSDKALIAKSRNDLIIQILSHDLSICHFITSHRPFGLYVI